MLISENGRSKCQIVIANRAGRQVRYAASQLQHFLFEIGSCRIPVIEATAEDENRVWENSIILFEDQNLGPEEFCLQTKDNNQLFISGGLPRGVVYGVFTLLEDYLGCKWFSSRVSRIPKREIIELPAISERQKPAFEYREPYMRDAFDPAWCLRNRMNSNKSFIPSDYGGHMRWYNFHHSFYQLINEKDYFDEHPEYFSMVNGQRVRERSQLCLTNPDVVRICTEKVLEWIRENPECTVFSVGQNDWGNYCQCDNCKAIDEAEGSQSGTVINFVNQIAEEVEKRYPDKLIHTFAYRYTRKAPRSVRPRRNVIVRLCTIECCFSHPLEECGEHNGDNLFLRDLKEWSAITDRLYIWDYVTNFSHYLLPFPNLNVLEANIKLFHRYGVKGVLEQGNFSFGGGGEMNELRAYVLAKLLWNPDYGARRAIDEFLDGYFGGAAQPIGEWLKLVHDAAAPYHARIYDGPDAPYYSDELIRKGFELFDRAINLVSNEEERARVEIARLPVRYLAICRMSPDDPARNVLIDKFADDVRAAGITELWERKRLEPTIEYLKNNWLDRKREIPRWSYYM